VNPSPYPDGEGPVFRCTRQGTGGISCDWLGFPAESDRCPLHPEQGRHRYEAANFNAFSFQPLWNYASSQGVWIYPADFMAMGCRARQIDGVEVVLFAYKHRQSRNYLHLDDHGHSAWTTGSHPEPIPPSRAIEHATGMDHRHGDGCLSGSRVVTIEGRQTAG
jgi:hypothetical protein